MSDSGSTGTDNTGSSKKKISPARNVIGCVVLVAVIVVGWFQYSAVIAYNRAVKALDVRTQDEEKGLLEVPEVEGLVGKSPDGPGIDLEEGSRTFTKTKYTWRGPLKSYTLTAYYTKGAGPSLHHFEPEGATYVPEPIVVPPSDAAGTTPRKARGKRGRGMAPGAEPSKTTAADSGKATAPGPPDDPPKPATTASSAPAKAAETAAEASKPPNNSSPVPPNPPE